jgi:hypothetical protein
VSVCGATMAFRFSSGQRCNIGDTSTLGFSPQLSHNGRVSQKWRYNSLSLCYAANLLTLPAVVRSLAKYPADSWRFVMQRKLIASVVAGAMLVSSSMSAFAQGSNGAPASPAALPPGGAATVQQADLWNVPDYYLVLLGGAAFAIGLAVVLSQGHGVQITTPTTTSSSTTTTN